MQRDRLLALYDEYKAAFSGKQIVLGDGPVGAPVLLVGESPGREEVRVGKPFVGSAGKNLTSFLEAACITREEVFITNVIKYRLCRISEKTGNLVNRPPLKSDIVKNRPYLLREIAVLQPELIVTLGNTALSAICGEGRKISEVHGQILSVESENIKFEIFPLFHPASILYRRDLEPDYRADMEKLREKILEN